jgi:hypothetical protein
LAEKKAKSKLTQFKWALKERGADVKAIQSEMYDMAKLLPSTQQANIMALLKTVTPEKQTKTNLKQLVKAIIRTEQVLRQAEQRNAVADLLKTASGIRSRIGKPMNQGGIRPEFAKKIVPILDSFTKPEATGRTIKAIASLSRHLQNLRQQAVNQFEEGYAESLIPKQRLRLLERIRRRPLTKMKADEVRTITEELQRLLHLNETKNRILMAHRIADAKETTTKALTELGAVKDRLAKEKVLAAANQKDSVIARAGHLLGGKYNDDVETLVERMTGGQQGAIYDSLATNIREGREQEALHKFEALDYIRKTLREKGITDADLRQMSESFWKRGSKFARPKRYVVQLHGRSVRLTMDEIMDVYMHTRAHYNVTHLQKSGLALPKRLIDPLGKTRIPADEFAAIEKLIGPKQKVLADMAAHIFENITKPALNKVTVEMDGIEKFTEPDYWPIERWSDRPLPGKRDASFSLIETQGWTQARVGGTKPFVIRGFWPRLMASIDASAEFVGMAKPLRSVKQILQNPKIIRTIDAKGYAKERQLLNDLFHRMESKRPEREYISEFFSPIMRGATRARLAEPGIFAGQKSSAVGYFVEADTKYAKALRVKPKRAELKEAMDHCAWFRARAEGGLSSIAAGDTAQTDKILRAVTGSTGALNWTTEGIRYVDTGTMMDGWRIAVHEADDIAANRMSTKGPSWRYWSKQPLDFEKGSDEYWTAVRRRADYLWRRTQPMFDVEGRSVLTSSRHPAARQFVLFRSYIDQALRMVHRANTSLANGRIGKAEYARQVGTVWAALAANVMIRALMRTLVYTLPAIGIAHLLWGRSRPVDIKRQAYKVGRDTALAPIKTLTFIGYLAYSAARIGVDIAASHKGYRREPDFDTLPISVVETIFKSAQHFSAAAGYQVTGEVYESGDLAGQPKAQIELRKGVTEMALGLGLLLGLPITPIERFKSELQRQMRYRPKVEERQEMIRKARQKRAQEAQERLRERARARKERRMK